MEVPKLTDKIGVEVGNNFEEFLENFSQEIPDSEDRYYPYIEQLFNLKYESKHTIHVNFRHLKQERYATTLHAITQHYHRCEPFLRQAVRNLVEKYDPEYLHKRPLINIELRNQPLREFWVAFYNLPDTERIRQLRSERVGHLITIQGTVTRTSEVRPELLYGTFVCDACKSVTKNVEQQFIFTEPKICQNPTCSARNAWSLNIEQSTFTDWQRVRIQENPDEIPTGSMPRTLEVILRNEMVEHAKPGQKCNFTGTLIVIPDINQLGVPGSTPELQRAFRTRTAEGYGNAGVTGLKVLGAKDLTYKLSFLACTVTPAETKTDFGSFNIENDGEEEMDQEQFLRTLTDAERRDLQDMLGYRERLYNSLVQSIVPSVCGHDIIKKGILLQLLGGVHKVTTEGINLRGDINVCIVGDPSTSKSQFLKYVCSIHPRAIYTSGKASSAAGLTAAVVKDEESGEFTIEAGALMLADNGICCIDEFDKMDKKDQVAIHEAMEQQTISIAKAGIHATLNARTSILSAANPIGGRYNRRLTLRQNVAMSGPIMSRFDLFFVVLDESNEASDLMIAKHILNIHRDKEESLRPPFTTQQILRFVRFARTFKPKLTKDAALLLKQKYVELRKGDAFGSGRNSYRITVRQLESMIRLSEAIARAHCDTEINHFYVEEASWLLKQSIIRVQHEDIQLDDEEDGSSKSPAEVLRPDDVVQGVTVVDMMETDNDEVIQENETQPTVNRQKAVSWDHFQDVKNKVLAKIYGSGGEIRKDELITWYLESLERQIQDTAQLDDEEHIFKKVLNKLLKENYLLEVEQGLDNENDDMQTEGEEGTDRPKVLVIHPNIDLDTL